MRPKVVLEDLHLGRLAPEDRRSMRGLEHAVRFAISRDAQLLLNGDTQDRCSLGNEKQRRREALRPAQLLEEYVSRTGLRPQIAPGNHDPEITDELLAELFPGIPFEKLGPVHLEEGMLSTHGHLVTNMTRTRVLIEQCLRGTLPPEALLQKLHDPELQREAIHPDPFHARVMRKIHGVSSLLHDRLERLVFSWERSKAAGEQELHGSPNRPPWGRYLVGKSLPDGAAHLAAALDCRLAVVGHSHVPGIVHRKVEVPEKHERDVIVANTGGWLGSDKGPRRFLHVTDSDVEMWECDGWQVGLSQSARWR